MGEIIHRKKVLFRGIIDGKPYPCVESYYVRIEGEFQVPLAGNDLHYELKYGITKLIPQTNGIFRIKNDEIDVEVRPDNPTDLLQH